jgi:hypothetical protein
MFGMSAEQAEDLDGLVTCGSEPVREPGVELSDLAGAHGDVVFGQDQPHLSRQHVEPFVALMGAKLWFVGLRRDNHFPGVQTPRLAGQRDDDASVTDFWSQPDSGVAYRGCPDQR